MADPRTLTTDRLVMTPHGLADFPDVMQMWSDPAVVPFLGGAPFNEEDSWARLLRYTGCWAVMGFGFWAVRDRASGAFLGDVGFLEARRTGVDGFDGDPEIGWTLNIAAQGKGYATEAVRAAFLLGLGQRGGPAVLAGGFVSTVPGVMSEPVVVSVATVVSTPSALR